MESVPSVTKDDVGRIEQFIRSAVSNASCSGVVIGLSGGLDSAVVTKLCVDALGKDNVLNVFMPSDTTPEIDLGDVKELSTLWGTELKVINIQNAVDGILSAIGDDGSVMDRGNASSRCRMTILYNIARRRNCLVIGTSNKSELMMGYFTKYGDGGCDIMPIADLYKTQVRELAKVIDIPERFISKPPSAGFWAGQTDEDEMHISYAELDRILYSLESCSDPNEAAAMSGSSAEKVREISAAVAKSAHKRAMPARPE